MSTSQAAAKAPHGNVARQACRRFDRPVPTIKTLLLVGIEVGGLFPDFHVDLLQDVVSRASLSQDTEDDPIQFRARGVVERAKGALVAPGKALHPQTQLSFWFDDRLLPRAYGFPMKLRIPTKLGFKNAKHIGEIEIGDDSVGGTWETVGYNWFSGL